jgi:hypothetical protein
MTKKSFNEDRGRIFIAFLRLENIVISKTSTESSIRNSFQGTITGIRVQVLLFG